MSLAHQVAGVLAAGWSVEDSAGAPGRLTDRRGRTGPGGAGEAVAVGAQSGRAAAVAAGGMTA